jgi:hypothetical protein
LKRRSGCFSISLALAELSSIDKRSKASSIPVAENSGITRLACPAASCLADFWAAFFYHWPLAWLLYCTNFMFTYINSLQSRLLFEFLFLFRLITVILPLGFCLYMQMSQILPKV